MELSFKATSQMEKLLGQDYIFPPMDLIIMDNWLMEVSKAKGNSITSITVWYTRENG